MNGRKVIHGRYELEPLARGGMGEVWVGHDTRLDREVAVKFVRFSDGLPEDEIMRRFDREARITARLRHPGVPAVFDVGAEGPDDGTGPGRPYLVMERVRGLSVADLVDQQERLPVGWAAAVAAQTCAVLAVAHEESLVHRDLKPSNLMVEPSGTVKVLDFGLAVAMAVADVSRITRSGQSIGTPAYMAPEQVMAAISEPRTDLYALGCTMYEMLTGRPVFSGATSYTVMNKQVDERPPPVTEQRPDVPAEVGAVLEHLLEKEPENRPGSAGEVYDRLLPFATDLAYLPGVVNPPTVPSPVRMYATVLTRAFQAPPPGTSPSDDGTGRPWSGSRSDSAGGAGEGGGTGRAGGAEGTGGGAGDAGEPHGDRGTTTATRPGTRTVTRDDLNRARADAGELATQARYREAAEILDATAADAVATFGSADPDVVNVRLEWANVLFEGGDYRTAAPAYEALIDDLTGRDGPDTELVFRCRVQYAECHARLGHTTTALDVAHRLRGDEERVFGPSDPRPIELRRRIGLWQLGAGRRDEARRTLTTLLDDLLGEHGEHHPAVPGVRDLLAGLPDGPPGA